MADLTRMDRDQLLQQWREYFQLAFSDSARSTSELHDYRRKRDEVKARYFQQLPRVPIGRCPFTETLAEKRMDTFGLDGPWWDISANDEPAQGGPHFVTYLGALNLNGHHPVGAAPTSSDEIQPGPEVPFVIPRLLNLPGVTCVISTRRMINDQFTAYYMAYFAERPLPADQGHQEWLRQTFQYLTPSGQSMWSAKNDVWDFDLQPWRQKDKLRWIAPGDASMRLRRGQDNEFPFLRLSGQPRPYAIRQGNVFPMTLPDGSALDPSD